MRKIWTLVLAAVAAALAWTAPAQAVQLHFVLSGAVSADFYFDSDPAGTPGFLYQPDEYFVLQDVGGMFPSNTPDTLADLVFYSTAAGGGMALFDVYPPDDGPVFFSDGPVMFSGDVSDPTFLTGSFVLTDFDEPSITYALSITAATTPPPAVPEPASWAMMITGLGAIGGLMRVRPRKVAFA